jgi:hypothetical protein
MTITYSLWQGSRLLSIGNTATNIKDIDKVVAELNDSQLAKACKFSANVQEIKVGK